MGKELHQIEIQGTTYPIIWNEFPEWPQSSIIIGLDIETTGLDSNNSKIKLAQLFHDEKVYILSDDNVIATLLEGYFIHSRTFVCHNALFEHAFLQPDKPFGCSMLMYKLYIQATEPNSRAFKADLASACKHILNWELDKKLQTSDWSGELSDEQIKYAAIDAVATYRLANALLPKITELGLLPVYNLNKQAQIPLSKMMLNGIAIDEEKHNELVLEWHKNSDEIEGRLRDIVGADLNLRSAKQVSDWLLSEYGSVRLKEWPKSPKTGHLQINTDALTYWQHLPLVKPLLEYKKYQKLISTYGEKFIQFRNNVTNRLHPSFRLCNTETGRLTCSQPNIQNQPRGAGFRSIFIPRPEYSFVVADYSQIELRCAAQLSQDEVMLNAYDQGQDLHSLTAANLVGCTLDSVTKDDRQLAKAVNFGLLFGAGARTLQKYAKKGYGIDMSYSDALEAVKAFRTTYHDYYLWQINTAAEAEISLQSRTPLSKLRILPDKGYYTRSMNTPIQGAAAEVMLMALIEVQNELHNDMYLVNCVHDEIILEVPDEKITEAKEILSRCMVSAWETIFPGATTRGLVEVNSGKNWEEAK